MGKPYIAGVGMTHFGFDQTAPEELAVEAVKEALLDACIETKEAIKNINDIDCIVFSNVTTPYLPNHQNLYSSVLASMFKTNVPIIRTEASCAGGGKALWLASKLPYKNILVVAFDNILYAERKMVTTLIGTAADAEIEQSIGATFPALNALCAKEYMRKYGVTREDLCAVSFKNHANATANPKAAFFGKEVTMDKILHSPIVSDPLHVHDCSVTTNGAAAVILTTKKTSVRLIGSGLAVDAISIIEREILSSWEATKQATTLAYAEAGINPSKIAIAEVHDAYTSTEIMAYDDLGFAKVGEGVELIRSGKTTIAGTFPINPSGGLKARGHPISPTGLAQVYEVVQQMRGQCGIRQIDKELPFGLTHNVGGIGGLVTVHVFEKV
jgi:acetyl-CoA C-acetyltransferase